MAADTLKSASITNLDAVPATKNTAGEGGLGYVKNITDYSTPTAGGLASTSSVYKLVRVKSTAKLKLAELVTDAALDTNVTPTLAADIGVYYSDATNDGTQAALQGTSISANALVANQKFGAATTLNIDALSNFSLVKRNQPLWQALGLSSDPGGYFDIVLAIHAVAATAAAGGNVGIVLDYVE